MVAPRPPVPQRAVVAGIGIAFGILTEQRVLGYTFHHPNLNIMTLMRETGIDRGQCPVQVRDDFGFLFGLDEALAVIAGMEV